MKMRNLYIILGVLVLVLGVMVVKTFGSTAQPLPDLHTKNQDYSSEINVALKSHQPLFVEFYGDY